MEKQLHHLDVSSLHGNVEGLLDERARVIRRSAVLKKNFGNIVLLSAEG